MFLGKVIGQVWATQKSPDLEGKRLLVIQALDAINDGNAVDMGEPVVTVNPPETTSNDCGYWRPCFNNA